MIAIAEIDHVAINVHYHVDQAEKALRRLGFQVTERGYHSLGSINHLMMFDSDYLELVGLPVETKNRKPLRPEIAKSCSGINGLVFKTSSTDEIFVRLQELGMAGDPPESFSRPVELANGTIDALFRTVKVRSDVFPGHRVYSCEHHTPEVVWRSEWQSHPNGATSVAECVIVAEDPARVAREFASILANDVDGSDDNLAMRLNGASLSFLSPNIYRERYGSLATSMGDRGFIFGALVIRTTDLPAIRRFVDDTGLEYVDSAERLIVREPSLDSILEFIVLSQIPEQARPKYASVC